MKGIRRTNYSSTCYINTALQTLFNFKKLSNFIKSNRFDDKDYPLLLQLQKLYNQCRSTTEEKQVSQYVSNKGLINCLRSKNLNINSQTQEDSTEFFETLIREIVKELTKTPKTAWKNPMNILDLLSTNIFEIEICQECRKELTVDHSNIAVDLETAGHDQKDTTIERKLNEFLQTKSKTSMCIECGIETRKKSSFNFSFSEYICLRISRNTWNYAANKLKRVKRLVKPEREMKLKSTHQSVTDQYLLIGGTVHKGSANSGHYFSIVNLLQAWYKIDDEHVSKITETKAIQELERDGVLMIYERAQTDKAQNDPKPNKEAPKPNKEVPYNENERAQNPEKYESPKSHFFRPGRRSFRPYRPRWKKVYREKSGYYDQDKHCFYIPKN